jgi:hypothetical protein
MSSCLYLQKYQYMISLIISSKGIIIRATIKADACDVGRVVFNDDLSMVHETTRGKQ